MNKKNVLIIQQIIPHYRIPIFNKLTESINLTIAAESFDNPDKYKFEHKRIVLIQIGPFVRIKDFSALKLGSYDAVIFLFNIRFINLWQTLLNFFRSYKLIVWGIGVSSEEGFDKNHRFDGIRFLAAKLTDALLFYSNYPLDIYAKKGGIKTSKMFVAQNTLALESKLFKDDKKYFLFVGTLKKYKKLDKLIQVYSLARKNDPNLADLHIIGDGDYKNQLVKQINILGLTEKVVLHGSITDTVKLESYYKKAIASVSPAQAGLSVLQSLSMGVPFITNFDSITGGERLNIINDYNGYLVKSDEELIEKLCFLSNDRDHALKLGENAYYYFINECSVDKMVAGFISVLE